METQASWERKRPKRVLEHLGGRRVLGIQGQGFLEDGAQAWEWRDLEQARKGPRPRKGGDRLPVRWCPQEPRGSWMGRGLGMRGCPWGAQHQDPEGKVGARSRAGPGLPMRGPGLGLGVRSPANPGEGHWSDAGGLKGKGL